MFSGVRPDSKEVIKQVYLTPLGTLQPFQPGLIDSKLQVKNESCLCSGYNTPNGNTVYIKKNLIHQKKLERIFPRQEPLQRSGSHFLGQYVQVEDGGQY